MIWIVTENEEYKGVISEIFSESLDFLFIITQTTSYTLNLLGYYKRRIGLPRVIVRVGTFGSLRYEVRSKIIVEKVYNDLLSRKFLINRRIITCNPKIISFFESKGYKRGFIQTINFIGEKIRKDVDAVDMETSVIFSFCRKYGINFYISLGIVSDNLGKNILPIEKRIKLLKDCAKDLKEWLEQNI